VARSHKKDQFLVVDNPDDILLTVRALQKNNFSNKAIVARAGKEALDFFP
jgi:two-component system response regulator